MFRICQIDAEEIAERYVMAKLEGPDLSIFEHHLAECSRCRELVQEAEEFVQAVRASGRRMKCPSNSPQGV